MANTANYNWPLPSPSGIQMNEVAKIATSFTAIDTKIKAFETSFSNHKHEFDDLEDKPTTLAGYGITDGMTAEEVAQAIKKAVDDLVNGAGSALDTLKELADALGNDPEFATTVGNALGVRVRVDAAQTFTLAEKKRGRDNIDAVGIADKGKPDGVASLDSTGKVPTAQLPALTTTETVGVALAQATSKNELVDEDTFALNENGGSTLRKTRWAVIKAAIKTFLNDYFVQAASPKITAPITNFVNGAFNYLYWISPHVAFIKKRGGYHYYWRVNDTGTDGGPNSVDLMVLDDNGILSVKAKLVVGAAQYDENGNAWGGIWANWGKTNAFDAIGNRIEERAAAHAATKTAPQQCSWNTGILEFGSVDPGHNNETADLPNPWVIVGLRSVSNSDRVYVRGAILRNYGG